VRLKPFLCFMFLNISEASKAFLAEASVLAFPTSTRLPQ
jgi:hypothetical protein